MACSADAKLAVAVVPLLAGRKPRLGRRRAELRGANACAKAIAILTQFGLAVDRAGSDVVYTDRDA